MLAAESTCGVLMIVAGFLPLRGYDVGDERLSISAGILEPPDVWMQLVLSGVV